MECLNCNSRRLVYDKNSDSYICLDCKYKYPKQYFFVSHSHLDIEKVRIIRNIIEETFFYEPILFFLKCLSDENELQNLIRREIDERIWFVYCKSQNAEKSAYVRDERAYLQKLVDGGKKINVLTVELDKFNIWDEECYDYIRRQIAYQIRKTKPFLCYSSYDAEAAQALYRCLQAHEYPVWMDTDLSLSSDWGESVKSHIKEHSYKDGCILMLISEKSINSEFIKREIIYALECNAFILPVVCSEGKPTALLYEQIRNVFPAFGRVQYLYFDTTDPGKSAEAAFEHLKDI